MYNPEIPFGQYLHAISLNVMETTSETIPSTKPKNDQSMFRNKKRSKTPEIPSVTLIRMEQLAPDGTTIANSDGRHEDHRAVY